MTPFHFAFYVKDLASTRAFYCGTLGCREGRSTDAWVDFDFFGHQLSAHVQADVPPPRWTGQVDGITVPERTSAEIVSHAMAGDDEACRATLEAFCAFLGGVAGNVALTMGARGGLFIAGGIVPRFTDFLRRSAFRERFEAKGRMSSYLERIATAVIIHPFPAFVGLAQLARANAAAA